MTNASGSRLSKNMLFALCFGSPSFSLVALANPSAATLGAFWCFGCSLGFLACFGVFGGLAVPWASLLPWGRSWVLGVFLGRVPGLSSMHSQRIHANR